MWLKILIVVAFIGIVLSLASGLFHLTRGNDKDKNVVKSLSIRVGLSISLFIILMALVGFGVIKPHGIYPEAQPQPASKKPSTANQE